MPIFYPAVSGDDGWFRPDGSEIHITYSYLAMGNTGGEVPMGADLFVRFPGVTIPKDSLIETAYIRFIARDYGTIEPCNVNCHFNDVDDAVAPTTAPEAVALALTTPFTWNDIPYWWITTPYFSPELKTLFQTIVNRPGWVEGNAVMIIFKNNASVGGAHRRASSFDYSGGAEKAELHITVEAPPSPAQPSHLTLMGIGI